MITAVLLIAALTATDTPEAGHVSILNLTAKPTGPDGDAFRRGDVVVGWEMIASQSQGYIHGHVLVEALDEDLKPIPISRVLELGFKTTKRTAKHRSRYKVFVGEKIKSAWGFRTFGKDPARIRVTFQGTTAQVDLKPIATEPAATSADLIEEIERTNDAQTTP